MRGARERERDHREGWDKERDREIREGGARERERSEIKSQRQTGREREIRE